MLLRAVQRLSLPSLARRSLSARMNIATTTQPSNGMTNGADRNPVTHTLTALKRWSCDDRELPGMALRVARRDQEHWLTLLQQYPI